MGAYKEYLAGIEELEAADAAGVDESALPPFEGAIVVQDELPEMPAPVISGILLETHKMLLTGPSKSHKTWGLINLAISVATGGYGVFGRVPDAVLDMTELVLDAGTMELARKVNSIADCRHPSAWRMSFTLREFEPRDARDLWFCFPLHQINDTGLLSDCKPNYGGQSEARKKQLEAENQGKVSQLDSACERLIGAGGFVYRDAVERELELSTTTVNRWLDRSKRFMRQPTSGGGKTKIVRRTPDVDTQAKGACQDALPLNP